MSPSPGGAEDERGGTRSRNEGTEPPPQSEFGKFHVFLCRTEVDVGAELEGDIVTVSDSEVRSSRRGNDDARTGGGAMERHVPGQPLLAPPLPAWKTLDSCEKTLRVKQNIHFAGGRRKRTKPVRQSCFCQSVSVWVW